jgi:hypothetical protein
MDTPQVNKQSISVDALGSLGFAPLEGSAVTPKTKDIFDMSSKVDQITGSNIDKALEQKKDNQPSGDNPPVEKPSNIDTRQLEGIADKLREQLVNTDTPSGDAPDDKQENLSKRAMVSYVKSRIEKGEFQPYNDYDDKKSKLTDYLNDMTIDQLGELIDDNRKSEKDVIKEGYQTEFYNSLPKHLQYVVRNLPDPTSSHSQYHR